MLQNYQAILSLLEDKSTSLLKEALRGLALTQEKKEKELFFFANQIWCIFIA